MKKINHGLLSLAPLVVFLLIYVTPSVLAGDFYKVPVSAVFLLACGLAGMSETIIVTFLAGGLLALIRSGGGLDLIIEILTRNVNGRRGAQFSIALLVALANLCTANNTIAIITTGGIANDVAKRFGICPQKTASLLDTFSCFVQGLIPYGVQILMAAGMFGISPASIIPWLYYPIIMGAFATLSIIVDHPRG